LGSNELGWWDMRPRRFTDPLGSKLPALEQNILKYRAMEMLLVMFYAEELKRDVLNRIQTTDRTRLRLGMAVSERAPKGAKNAVDKALNALVADRAISAADKIEIVKLIDYRNVIGHQMQNLLLDVSPERTAWEMITYLPDRLPKYDYKAVARLRHFLDLLDRSHHYVMEASFDRMLFGAAEKTFLAELKRLDRKILRLAKVRQSEIKLLNAELSLEGTELEGECGPQHPLSHYDDGRLTKRGVEICYRLFDRNKSAMAVAHLIGLSLRAARKRQRMWETLGGKDRIKVDIATIPHRQFYRRYDD
jgi:hypothetical protein